MLVYARCKNLSVRVKNNPEAAQVFQNETNLPLTFQTRAQCICQTFFFPELPHTPPYFSIFIHRGIPHPSQCNIPVFFFLLSFYLLHQHVDLALLGCVMIPVNPEIPSPPPQNGLSHMFSPVVAPIVFKIQDSIPEHDGPEKERSAISAFA